MIDAETWRAALAELPGRRVTAAMVVQCALDWLLPSATELRDEIDQAIAEVALSGCSVRIDRIILHDVPVANGRPSGDFGTLDFEALNAAHADWSYRLSVVADLIPETDRPRVHRLITGGKPHSVMPVDGIELQVNGQWQDPSAVAGAMRVIRSGATTPLTSYDIDRDGPFGDADPSVYL